MQNIITVRYLLDLYEPTVTSPTTAVYADPEPQSLQALKHCLRKAWKSISMTTLQTLIVSMP